MHFLQITLALITLLKLLQGQYYNIYTFGPLYGFESFCLIGNAKPKNVFFDMNNALSVIYSNKSDPSQFSNSMSISTDTINYLGKKAQHGTDRLNFFDKLILPSFSFVFIHQSIEEEEGKSTIALGYGETSYLNQIKNANIIRNRRFAFFNESLYVDDFTNEFAKNKRAEKSKCKTISSVEPSWGCKLSGILLGNYNFNTKENPENEVFYNEMNYIQLSTVATFDTNEYFIVAPYRMAEFFEKNYFGHFYTEEACASRIADDKEQIDFKCNEKVVPLLNNINLIFEDKTSIILTPKELFAGDFNNFAIVFRKSASSAWVIGKMITVEHSPIFDMDDKSITFPINMASATVVMKRIFGLKLNLFGGIICSASGGIILLVWTYFAIIKASDKEYKN